MKTRTLTLLVLILLATSVLIVTNKVRAEVTLPATSSYDLHQQQTPTTVSKEQTLNQTGKTSRC